jgi:hypothetical protein
MAVESDTPYSSDAGSTPDFGVEASPWNTGMVTAARIGRR